MQFDDQLLRYFGTVDLGDVSPEALQGGSERLRVDFGLETDRPRRFAMWALMHILGSRPTSKSPSSIPMARRQPAASWA